jgi:streptogramin lyase
MYNARLSPIWLVALVILAVPVPAQTMTEFPLPNANSQPYGIVTGPDGNLWFTEFRGHRIGRITPAGEISEFATPTPDSAPIDIAVGPDGALWFTESLAGRVGRITSSGEITDFPTGAFAIGDSTVGIARGPDGTMWFTEWDAGQIGRFSPGGIITLFSIPDPPRFGAKPNDIVAGPDGALWFTEVQGSRIGRITTSGAVTQFAIPTAASAPLGITAGPDGNLWFTEHSGHKIGRITPGGMITEFPGASFPHGITAGPDGNLWFTERGTNKIGRITTTGVITEFPIPATSSSPVGITTGPDGNIWFTDPAANKIWRLTLPSAPAVDSRILPVVGSTAGVGGSFFRTAVQIHNPTSEQMMGRLVFHRSGDSGASSDPALSYSLSSGQTRSIADLLPSLGLSGVGTADIEVTSGQVPTVSVRVFNDAGAQGTTGFTEEPMRAEDALRPEVSGALLLPVDPTRFRFNIGVRTLGTGATATLTVRDASGAVLETVSRTFPPTYHEQRSASEFLGVSALPTGGSIGISMTSGSAIFYGATVDNTTGDPSLQVARPAPQR